MPHLMILPHPDPARMHLVCLPTDYEGQEAFRHITGLIAAVESQNSHCTWEDIAEQLESQGYEIMPFLLGPSWED
jgi:hypothetical protein